MRISHIELCEVAIDRPRALHILIVMARPWRTAREGEVMSLKARAPRGDLEAKVLLQELLLVTAAHRLPRVRRVAPAVEEATGDGRGVRHRRRRLVA